MPTTRRDVLRLGFAAAAGLGLGNARRAALATAAEDLCPMPRPNTCLAGVASTCSTSSCPTSRSAFDERDFADIAELGFDFVRLPLDYRCWTEADKPSTLKEPVLKEIDQAVEFGKKHGIHVQINFHRAPGFTVAKPAEPKSIWSDPEILGVCAAHWSAFASRYQGRPNNEVSFNLLNEPDDKVKPEDHRRVVERRGRRDSRTRPEAIDRLRRPRVGDPAPHRVARARRGRRAA